MFALDEYDETIIQFIERNIPKEFDMKTFDKKLINKILDFYPSIIRTNKSNIVKLWDDNMDNVIKTIKLPNNCSSKVIFSPDGRLILSGGTDGSLKIFDCTTGELVQTFKGHATAIKCLALSPDGKRIASGASALKIWDVDTGDLVCILNNGKIHNMIQTTFRNTTDDTIYTPIYEKIWFIRNVVFSPDGKMIIVLYSGVIGFWNNVVVNLLKILVQVI